jgi:hypothetical protein
MNLVDVNMYKSLMHAKYMYELRSLLMHIPRGRSGPPGSLGYSPGLGPRSIDAALANFCQISVRRQPSPCPGLE